MSIQQTSRPRIVAYRIAGIIASILGYFIDFIFGITLIFAPTDGIGTIIALLIFIAIGTWLIIYGIKTKRKILRFKKYVSIISLENGTSLEIIANECSQSIDFVRKDLEVMITQKFFTNAYIDRNTNEIVLERKNNPEVLNNTMTETEAVESKVVTCKNCGASNNITIGTIAECEFCGSVLNS
ncbi:hypothetical protein [Clostridium saccharoperbutylacetonicum]|jgi:hypothetical protein